MKTLCYVLLMTGLLLTTYSNASAQCYNNPGFLPKAAGVDRYYQFQAEGRTFAFDRQTGDIFCGGQRIGVKTPDGQVQLDPAAVARLEGNAGAPVAGQPAPAVQPGVPGAAGQPIPAPVGQPGVNGAVPPAPAPAQGVRATPVSAPIRAQSQVAPAAGGIPNAIPAPVAAPGAPPVAGAQAIPVAGGQAIPALGSVDPATAINPAFTGQWRAENKNILGRNTLRELTIEGNELTLRVQTAGEEAQLIEGKMEFNDGKLTVKGSNQDFSLGALSVNNGQLILNGDEALTFKRIEE